MPPRIIPQSRSTSDGSDSELRSIADEWAKWNGSMVTQRERVDAMWTLWDRFVTVLDDTPKPIADMWGRDQS